MYKRKVILRFLPADESVLSSKTAALYWLVDVLGFSKRGRRMAADVLDALFYYVWGKGIEPSPEQVLDFVNKRRIGRGERKVSYEAVRQYLEKFEAMGMIERRRGKISLRKGMLSENFVDAMFEDLERLRDVMKKVVASLKSHY